MSTSYWLPALVVLGLGLASGLVAAFNLRLRRAGKAAEKHSPDLELKIRDLESRRDDIYRRLRSDDGTDLTDSERHSLEQAAARTLKELDRIQGQLPHRPTPAAASRQESDREAAEVGAAPRTRRLHPLVSGGLVAIALIALVSVLIFFAVRDAGQSPSPAMTAGQPQQEPAGLEIPPEVAARIAALQARIQTEPTDIMARKELATLLLGHDQFMEAFEHAGAILATDPQDPDGLYVQGVVRVTMGQTDLAVNLLDRVLAQHPDHLGAMLYRGLALYQGGQVESAVDTWEMGLELAGGSHPDFEHLLQIARSEPPPTGNSETTTDSAEAPEDGAYALQIDLAPGVQVTGSAVLFVYLQDGPGPPAAAKRVVAPRFPVQVTLGDGDSMMGDSLPAKGILTARLDSDGDLGTSSDLDLSAQADALSGSLTRLVLRN